MHDYNQHGVFCRLDTCTDLECVEEELHTQAFLFLFIDYFSLAPPTKFNFLIKKGTLRGAK